MERSVEKYERFIILNQNKLSMGQALIFETIEFALP